MASITPTTLTPSDIVARDAAVQAIADAAIPLTQKGAVNGVAALDSSGNIVGQIVNLVCTEADLALITLQPGQLAWISDGDGGGAVGRLVTGVSPAAEGQSYQVYPYVGGGDGNVLFGGNLSTGSLVVADGSACTFAASVKSSVTVAALAAGAENTTAFAFSGAHVGDDVSVTPPAAFPVGLGIVAAYVSTSNVVSFRVRNFSGSTITPSAGTFTVTVRRWT